MEDDLHRLILCDRKDFLMTAKLSQLFGKGALLSVQVTEGHQGNPCWIKRATGGRMKSFSETQSESLCSYVDVSDHLK